MTAATDPVFVSLADLLADTIPFSTLVAAFGPSSLGILLVRDLPASFVKLRSQVLSNASRVAHLPPTTLQGLTNERAKYLVGWSHGKEMLRPGVVDRGKGSYYINCGFHSRDAEGSLASGSGEEGKRESGFEEYMAPNLWPDEDDIPGFRESAQELIIMIIDIAILVARACDKYAAEAVQGYRTGLLEQVVRTSRTTKARLLHYFPAEDTAQAGRDRYRDGGVGQQQPQEHDGEAEDDWCATHLDHGCLTGLTSAMFIDESSTAQTTDSATRKIHELPKPPSPSCGLHICSRDGKKVKVSIPRDCLAFQTGEALELMTQGRFKAVPHFVRGVPAGGERIARNTLAVFTQPNVGDLVDDQNGITFGDFARSVVNKNTA